MAAATGLREHQARGGVRWGGEQAGAGAAGRAWHVRQVTGESLETGVPALPTGQCPAVRVHACVCGLGYGKQLQVCTAPGRCVGPLGPLVEVKPPQGDNKPTANGAPWSDHVLRSISTEYVPKN